MLASDPATASHGFTVVGWGIASGATFVILYYILMGLRHRKWAATGAAVRMFLEVWFLTGAVILAVRTLKGYEIGTHAEDYVFVALGLLTGSVVCLKHVHAMFFSIFRPKQSGWSPSTENATE